MKRDKVKFNSFNKVYHEHYNNLVKFAYKLIGNYDDANDICQELYVDFYNEIDTIEKPEKWLYGALRYKVFNFFRAKKIKHTDLDNIPESEIPHPVDNNIDIRILLCEMLDDDNNFQDDMDRSLLDLIAFQNFSYEKAADALGTTKYKVRYKYGLLLNRLKEYLQKSGIKDIEALLCMIIMITI